MKSRKLKNIIIFMLAIFSIIGCCLLGYVGHIDYGDGGEKSATGISESGDFSLELTINKTKVRVTDTVEVSATFKNLSGKAFYILGFEDLYFGSKDDVFCRYPIMKTLN